MAKCDICKEKVPTTFLNKVLGTYVYDSTNKKKLVCFNCQKKFASKEAMLAKL